MSSSDNDEERIWKEAYEKSLIDKKYQADAEVNQKRKDILKIDEQIAETQLRKEELLEQEASLRIRVAEIQWHTASYEYKIIQLNHQKAITRLEGGIEEEEEKETLMDVALSKVKPKDNNLTLYSDSE